MNSYLIFIFGIILVIIFVIIFLYDKFENFDDDEKNNENIFFIKKFPNIYYTEQYYDKLYIPPKPNMTSLANITIDSYLNSDIVMKKLECSNITNQAKCWDNNNCQWVERIGSKSFCTTAPKMLL